MNNAAFKPIEEVIPEKNWTHEQWSVYVSGLKAAMSLIVTPIDKVPGKKRVMVLVSTPSYFQPTESCGMTEE